MTNPTLVDEAMAGLRAKHLHAVSADYEPPPLEWSDSEESPSSSRPLIDRDAPLPPRELLTEGGASMAAPLPALEYLVPHLGIAAGAPVGWGGYGFSGKTVSLQSLALSVASGAPLWGTYTTKRGRVLHLDYEQGRRLTVERYQRLARAAGIDLAELDDNLRLAALPQIYLDSVDVAQVLARACEGFSVVIVDSLRAAAPTVDENSSDLRRVIDPLTRISEKTGVVPFVIHHARKPKEGEPAGARFSLRGSSAFFDACASVFILGGAKGEPVQLQHEKCRWRGTTVDTFGLAIEDVEVDGDPRGGLRVRHLEAEQIMASAASGGLDGAMRRVEDLLRSQHGGRFAGSKNALLQTSGMGRTTFLGAISRLESLGLIDVEETPKGKFIQWRNS